MERFSKRAGESIEIIFIKISLKWGASISTPQYWPYCLCTFNRTKLSDGSKIFEISNNKMSSYLDSDSALPWAKPWVALLWLLIYLFVLKYAFVMVARSVAFSVSNSKMLEHFLPYRAEFQYQWNNHYAATIYICSVHNTSSIPWLNEFLEHSVPQLFAKCFEAGERATQEYTSPYTMWWHISKLVWENVGLNKNIFILSTEVI